MLDNVGYFTERGKTIPDDKVEFCDGILYVITETKTYKKILCGGYDEPISLSKIAEDYPVVIKVIFEDSLRGVILNYNNHREVGWETTGTTIGYA